MHRSWPSAVTWLIYTHYSQYNALSSPVACPCPSSKAFFIRACAHGKMYQFSPSEDTCASPLSRGFGLIMPIEAEGDFLDMLGSKYCLLRSIHWCLRGITDQLTPVSCMSTISSSFLMMSENRAPSLTSSVHGDRLSTLIDPSRK
jgi:hypothetical protein